MSEEENKDKKNIDSDSKAVNEIKESNNDKVIPQNKNPRNPKKNTRSGHKRRERHELPPNTENLPPLSLQDMQTMEINNIKSLAEQYELQDFTGYSKHQLIFEILKTHGRRGGPMQGKGVLEVLPDGFGFLRSPLNSYQPAPDDIYVSPSQIRRFGLRTGDSVEGAIRAPKDKERFFAIHFLEKINNASPEEKRKTVPFENRQPANTTFGD